MERRSHKGLCHRCQRSALVLDRNGVPFCGRHALAIGVPAPRLPSPLEEAGVALRPGA